MKKVYLFVTLAMGMSLAKSQQLGQLQPATLEGSTSVKKCATVEILNEARRQNPLIESDAKFEQWMANLIQQRKNLAAATGRTNLTNYNLPVVFHILHNGEAEGSGNNIPQSVIQQQLLQLNKDYANLSNSPYSVSANSGIQFSLAQRDPYNNVLSQPGIDRVNRNAFSLSDPTTGWTPGYINASVKPATYWDPSRFINIWLVPSMPQAGGEILGYATFPISTLSGLPAAGETDETAGVVIKTTVAGSVFQPYDCAASFGQGRTLTHELGHFFGLRHIWGDTNCGTDYCDDTPIHLTSNSGVPSHPKPNSCGTADEMFENYMDYSNDNILNTFTQNQVDRMQVVMANSVRRASLATSNVGLVPATGTNRIAFNECSTTLTVSERATTGTYPRYRDVNLYLNVDGAATGAATVTLTATGTAVLNQDYTFPTSPVTFAAGDRMKPVTIRILDDATVDGNKTLTVGFSISGTGVTAGTTSQTYSITIVDDDNFITSNIPVTLLSENFNGAVAGWGLITFGTNSSGNTFTISNNGNAGGSGACAHVTNNTTTRPNTYNKSAPATIGLRTPLINASQYQNLSVSFNYRVWGEATSTTPYDYGQLIASFAATPNSYTGINATGAGPYAGVTDSVTSVANVSLPANFNTNQFYLAFLWSNDDSEGNDPPLNIDNVLVRGLGTTVEDAISSSYGYDVPASTVNNFRSVNNKSVAAISASNASYTNVTAAVTEAGNDRPTFTSGTTNYLRTRKIITLNSNPANTTGQYTLKLYYTTAELAAWGASIPSLRIMKVNSGVALSGNLNTSTAMLITPSLVEDSSTSKGYYAFTATVTGFGQFVLVNTETVLPVKLLSFTGVLDKAKTRLNWKTAEEINNKGFEVERSTDAVQYNKIAWVDASSTKTYELYDANIVKGTKYYYRLKQVDVDGRSTYSPVVSIVYNGEGISVFPNPVKNDLIVQQSGTGRTSVVVTDLAGKAVYQSTFTAGSLKINTESWSNGIYMVRVVKDDNISTFKVMKQ